MQFNGRKIETATMQVHQAGYSPWGIYFFSNVLLCFCKHELFINAIDCSRSCSGYCLGNKLLILTALVKLLVMTVLVTKNESLDVLRDRQFQVVIFLLIILVRTMQQLLFQCFVFSSKLVNFPSQLRNFCLGVCQSCCCCCCCCCYWRSQSCFPYEPVRF